MKLNLGLLLCWLGIHQNKIIEELTPIIQSIDEDLSAKTQIDYDTQAQLHGYTSVKINKSNEFCRRF